MRDALLPLSFGIVRKSEFPGHLNQDDAINIDTLFSVSPFQIDLKVRTISINC